MNNIKELKEKTLKGLQKCYRFTKGDEHACYGCPYDDRGIDCFDVLMSNAFYVIKNLDKIGDEEENDRENQQ